MLSTLSLKSLHIGHDVPALTDQPDVRDDGNPACSRVLLKLLAMRFNFVMGFFLFFFQF